MGKYISHLDLLRTFTRAIHRAELPVRYSQGFNPHQLITFSLPLPIGVTSETEFVDIDFEDSADNREIIRRLNENLPPDIRILGASEPAKSANDIVAASYSVHLEAENGINPEKTKEFFCLENIPALKKTKKGEKEINVKEYIKKWEITKSEGGILEMDITLSAGGSANIKPEILLKKLAEFLGIEEFSAADVHRTRIFCSVGDKTEIFC